MYVCMYKSLLGCLTEWIGMYQSPMDFKPPKNGDSSTGKIGRFSHSSCKEGLDFESVALTCIQIALYSMRHCKE